MTPFCEKITQGCQNDLTAIYGLLSASQAVSGVGVLSDNRMAEPIPGKFPNDFG